MTCHLKPWLSTPCMIESSSDAVHMSPRFEVAGSSGASTLPEASTSAFFFCSRMYRLRTASSECRRAERAGGVGAGAE
eukprot:scaffold52161_cov33-Tisochrysis_lutea.AAC.2